MKDDTFWFACHQTTGMKHGKRVRPANQSMCAGLMGVQWRMGRLSVAARIALFANMITVGDLKACAKKTFRTLDAFAKHHKRG
jgi:hypothetical protein